MRSGFIVAALLLSAVGAWAQMNCSASQLAISPTTLPNGSAGAPYSQTLMATLISGAAYSWNIASGALPPGLTLSQFPSTQAPWIATISGTPAIGGTFSFTVKVVATPPSGAMLSCSQPYTMTISGSGPPILPQVLPNGNINLAYSQGQLSTASFPNATYSWSILSSGQLPPGLSLSSSGSSALISGTPTTQGTYSFTVKVDLTFPGPGQSSASQNYIVSIFTMGGGFSITTASLPDGSEGQAYSQQLTTNAAPDVKIAWSVSSGQLPPGLVLNPSTGVISGVPTTGGAYMFVVTAIEQVGLASGPPTASVSLSIRITGPKLSIVETSLPVAVQGSPYNVTLTPIGGLPPYQWTFGATTTLGLTIGLTTGAITGTPMTTGNFTLVVVLTDSLGLSIRQTFSLFVATPLKVLTPSLPNGSAGTPYSQTLMPGGGQPPYRWSVASGNLPSGLQLDPGTGAITGTPTTNGTYAFTVQLSDSGNRTYSANLAITIGPGLTITTTSLPDGTAGVAYSATLTTSGGAAPVTWSITGTLPDGLKFDTAAGAITGTPTTAGTQTITFQATDFVGATAQVSLTINIRSFTITTSSLPDAIIGVPYSQTIATIGGQAPLTFSISQGALPGGLSLNPATGAIGGTPAATGAFSFTVSVTDSSKQIATAALAILVANPLTISTGNLTATAGVAFSVTIAASGGTQPYVFAISSGTLPAGLQFDPASATISGTPAASGSASIVFTITDARQQAASKTIIVTVNPPPPTVTIGGAPNTAPSGTQLPLSVSIGAAYPQDIAVTVTLAFASAVGRADPMIGLCNGSLSLTFTISAGQTQGVFPCGPNVVRTGTTAGRITLAVHMDNGAPDTTASIVINPAPPVITAATFQQNTGGFTISAAGFSNTGELVSATFDFVPASNNTFATSHFVVPLGSAAGAYYQRADSTSTGTAVIATFPFTVQGNAQAVVSYKVTLTNSKGDSNVFPGNP